MMVGLAEDRYHRSHCKEVSYVLSSLGALLLALPCVRLLSVSRPRLNFAVVHLGPLPSRARVCPGNSSSLRHPPQLALHWG